MLIHATPSYTACFRVLPLLACLAFPGDLRSQNTQDGLAGDSAEDRIVPAAKLLRHARRTIGRYDANRDGRLQQAEWAGMKGEPATVDRDADGSITVEELIERMADFGRRRSLHVSKRFTVGIDDVLPLLQPTTESAADALAAESPRAAASPDEDPQVPRSPLDFDPRRDRKFAARLPKGIPDWFIDRDGDGDGQLTLAEFAPKPTAAERNRFVRFDRNNDGVVTAAEYLKASSP